MKQLIQSLRSGTIELIETPIPAVRPGHLLIQTYASIISKGTEENLLEFGRASLFQKAKLQPDKVTQARAKLKTDGFNATLTSIRAKLDKPITPGYSQSGVVVAIGSEVSNFRVGDRVVSNSSHAEFVCAPTQLCVKIPDLSPISFEEAAFTPIASIALQSVRLLNPTLGEYVVVQGLGVIGLITVQLLKAQGCQVMGIDFDGPRLELAQSWGAEIHSLTQNPNPVPHAITFSKGQGVDGVIVSASTQSSEPIHFAAQMSRKRGKIILVGSTGTKLSRTDFYEKELSFQVSCSYGPGRYDKVYEQKGVDYPIGFVRWTENRNMEAILTLMKERKINLTPLISHRFPFSDSMNAYDLIASKQHSNAIALSYPVGCQPLVKHSRPHLFSLTKNTTSPRLGMIGSGEHTTRVLLPLLKKLKRIPTSICSLSGLSATLAARKFGIAESFSDTNPIINSPNIDAVLIASRHDSHAELVIQAIFQNKHIFIEKPIATSIDELNQIEKAIISSKFSKNIWVGYNRRFSPISQKLKSLLSNTIGPKHMVYTVNALSLSETHWTQDRTSGGGRIVSELGHFIDLLRFFTDAPILDFSVTRVSSELIDPCNSLTVSLKFEEGSVATLTYSTLGNRAYPKETLEIFTDNKVAIIDNFKSLTGYGFKNFTKMKLWSQDKGHENCLSQFINSISISNSQFDNLRWTEILEISRVICQIQDSTTIEKKYSPRVA